MMREPGKKAVKTQTIGIETLNEYLKTHSAESGRIQEPAKS